MISLGNILANADSSVLQVLHPRCEVSIFAKSAVNFSSEELKDAMSELGAKLVQVDFLGDHDMGPTKKYGGSSYFCKTTSK